MKNTQRTIKPQQYDAVPFDRYQATGIKVWDLPTRLFHWLLAACVSGAIVTAQLGGNWIDWHLRLGVATVALLAFRLVWGVLGPRYARFASFLYGPASTLRHLREFGTAARHAGHSPSGAVAVFLFLGMLAAQSISGLFSSDSISTEGPLARFAGESMVELASWLHVTLQWAIYALIGAHIIAILLYWLVKRDNLVRAMLTGWKHGLRAAPANDSLPVRAAGIALLAGLTALAFLLLT
jgi:cytochrome b